MDLSCYFETMKEKEVFATGEETSQQLIFFEAYKALPLIGPDKER